MDFLKIGLQDGQKELNESKELFKLLATRGTLEIEIYKPDKIDLQQPHKKDELYVVIKGEGTFICGNKETAFKAHDILFAPAGIHHRFVDFSANFLTWVIFYGPEGGEKSEI
jgi:mannose-6-phosphate isomerase-like protein (cupin superfamily)